jgi:hypothetical protein
MTGPHFDAEDVDDTETRPISVAELLAKNGTVGSPPVTGRRRRRRGNSDAVTVAELTGEIPVIRVDEDDDQAKSVDENEADSASEAATTTEHRPNGSEPAAEAMPERTHEVGTDDRSEAVKWSDPRPRWPKSPSQLPTRAFGPERSSYPRPTRQADQPDDDRARRADSGAEQMSPDPSDNFADAEVDVMDTDVRDVEPPAEDPAEERSFLRGPRKLFRKLRGGKESADDEAAAELDDDDAAELDDELTDFDDSTELDDQQAGGDEDDETAGALPESLGARLRHGATVVLQSLLAVVFGAGLFLAFDQLWRWNNIVALVLSVLVTLGLVAAVQVVRKTVDTTSTLIAVAVGLLITLGPLALLRSG